MEQLPDYVSAVFILTTLITMLFFFAAVRRAGLLGAGRLSLIFLVGSMAWLALQAALGLKGVYGDHPDAMPPRLMMFGVFPALVLILLLFITGPGRRFIDSLSLRTLTYLNVVRVPVELVLYWLFLNKLVPGVMTFEGRNFDILAGLTAPLVAYYGFSKGVLNRRLILIWNILSLTLLINIVVTAILSIPSPFQKIGFSQPNMAVLYFPFCWLPSYIVPMVLFGHLVSIRRLVKEK